MKKIKRYIKSFLNNEKKQEKFILAKKILKIVLKKTNIFLLFNIKEKYESILETLNFMLILIHILV